MEKYNHTGQGFLMNLLTKKISGLSPEELNELSKTLGTSGLPYPASHFVTDTAGKLQMEIGIIADDAHPLTAYSNRSHDYVIGQLYCRMAIPSLLHVQKESLLRRAPESKSRVMLILGKPSTGKSEGAKTIADACDERGADVVDCGGRYLGDLLWEQVIDYGEDFKTALTERIRSGKLTAESVNVIEKRYPEALVKEDGKIIGIDWSKTAAPEKSETDEAALERSIKFAKTIAEYESIPTQTVNSVGIKKVPGVIKKWHEEGRTGILDEYTKSVEGSDDSLQTVLQYLNGEIDEVTVTNTMKVAGRDETYSYTLKRDEMKAGFFVYMTGNDQEDGVSTHMLSKSAYSRLPVFKIEDPLSVDWKHRISQVLTGMPLSTLYSVFSDTAADDAKEFSQMMIELRLMGLSADQQANVPTSQLTMLNNWQQTNTAVEKLANFYMYWAKIIDPKSDFYDPEKSQNQSNIDNVMPEISASYRDESAIDFRKVIQDMAEALKVKPAVKKINGGSGLRLNFSEVGRKKTTTVADSQEVISAEFGTRLEAVLLERIGTMTQGRPNLQAALIKEARERGVLTIDPTKEQETVSKLLNQDMYTEVGGIKTIVTLREALVARLKQANPDLKGKSDDEVMPMDQAVAACEELAGLASETANNTTARSGRLIILGKDLTHVFNRVSAVDGIGQSKPDANELVSTSDFLESLKIPAVANMNMKGIWRSTISAEKFVKPSKENTPIVQIAEGKSASKVGITTIMMQGANDDTAMVPMHIMVDETRKKGLIVTDVVDAATKAALGSDFTIVSYDDANAETQVAAFIKETLQHPSRKTGLADLEKQLSRAFVLRAGNEGQLQPLAQMMTTRDLPTDAPVYMVNQPV
jgi:hypothetical protein